MKGRCLTKKRKKPLGKEKSPIKEKDGKARKKDARGGGGGAWSFSVNQEIEMGIRRLKCRSEAVEKLKGKKETPLPADQVETCGTIHSLAEGKRSTLGTRH